MKLEDLLASIDNGTGWKCLIVTINQLILGGFFLPFPMAALQGSAASLGPLESEMTVTRIDF